MTPAAFCCYVLVTNDGRRTYCGSTNNLTRRLRQHRGEIAGGARYTTTTACAQWHVMAVVRGFANRAQACSFEWRVKHTTTLGGWDALRRRRHQLLCTLRDSRWWTRYPPRPVALEISGTAALLAGLPSAEAIEAPCPVTLSPLRVDGPPLARQRDDSMRHDPSLATVRKDPVPQHVELAALGGGPPGGPPPAVLSGDRGVEIDVAAGVHRIDGGQDVLPFICK